MRKKTGYAGRIAGLVIVLSGLFLFLYPDLKTRVFETQAENEIRIFQESNLSGERDADAAVTEEKGAEGQQEGAADAGTEDTEASGAVLEASPALLEQITQYNQRIYAEHQKDFKDAWSVAQSPQVMEGIADEMFGYLEIPVMDVRMPLYLGASSAHLAKGAAVLGETSIPIGGTNTNAVIAGHRGFRGIPYFREIEKIKTGDHIFLTNPWETLVYQAVEIRIISPDDSDAVTIREGKDMITLITCHPYRSGGKYRYLVFCERTDGDGEGQAQVIKEAQPEYQAQQMSGEIPQGAQSSQADLDRERLVRRAGLFVILLFAGVMSIRLMAETLQNKQRKERRK